MSDGHYFATEPTVASSPRQVTLTLPDLTLHLATDRGVFSAGGVDPGTKLLLLSTPPPTDGPVLDLGCGYGPVALTLAHRAPGADVWAVDVNERALGLCAQNAVTAGLTNVRVAAPEAVPPGLRFAAIWSNPPIRIGKAALHDLLGRWLVRLVPGGRAHLVVGRNLGADSLAVWLTGEGFVTTRRTSRQGYRVLDVEAGP